jgi:hypothetical protein
VAESKVSEHSRKLADEATRRGWQYSASGDHLDLARRWRWPPRYEHPFERRAQERLGLDRHYDRIGDVLSGATRAGRPFWAFWYTLSDNVGHGFASTVRRSVAFIYTAVSLPTVSVAKRHRTGDNSILSVMADSAAKGRHQQSEVDAERAGRMFGWAVGSEEFQRRYRVKAEDRQSAEWLAGPVIQRALLSHEPAISLTSNRADILAWTDYGWTDSGGGVDYGGQHISAVEDLDIVTVDALLNVLDVVPTKA